MKAMKFYIPLKDLQAYTRQSLPAHEANTCFIPVKVEVNDIDFSVEITMLATEDDMVETVRERMMMSVN